MGAACGLADELLEFRDEGAVCVGARVGGVTGGPLIVDEPAPVWVTFPTCLSSSCSQIESTECEVTLEDGDLVIRSHGVVRDTRGRGGGCTDDCGFLVAECFTPALAEGTYTVRHGDETFEVVGPSDAPHCDRGF
jgi:hypothetical protein